MRTGASIWRSGLGICVCLMAACTRHPVPPPVLAPLGGSEAASTIEPPRINGNVGAPNALPPAELSYGTASPPSGTGGNEAGDEPKDISLDFVDTDIRDVVDQILGHALRVNFTIDPQVHGTATFHTNQKLSRAQLLPILRVLLDEDGAVLNIANGVYRVLPSRVALGPAGAVVVPLHYASAEGLVKVLQPFVSNSGRITADPGRNALLVSGDAATVGALTDLIHSFDISQLAGQSFALLPVGNGSPKDVATALQEAFRGQNGGALQNVVHVLPMDGVGAVLVVTSQPAYLNEARRLYGLLQRQRGQTVRSWYVYYLQNSHADDMAYVLQQAFTPSNVTAQPSQPVSTGNGMQPVNGLVTGQGTGGGLTGGGAPSGLSGGLSGSGLSGGGSAGSGAAPQSNASLLRSTTAAATGNPLLGGLDQSNGGNAQDQMRIIPDEQNNALLVYATPHEENTVEAMLHKIDIQPLQVRIDATIAEVRLNDTLQYGTQFFFRAGGINGMLNNATGAVTTPLAQAPFAGNFPGFVIGGKGIAGAPLAISALQAVTKVDVLSSPELVVLNNQPAKLQVGDLVPYLTGTANVLTTTSTVVNTVNYRETGVIMDVTPRVNSGGQVTLDIAQEVSGIDTSVTPASTGINSPTFSERTITSRVVVQDGQTVGLAGLISDNVSHGNQGIPWLKDIPILGALAGSQNNQRQRDELLVLITPHVIHDSRDARLLTEDMRREMINAALVPQETDALPASGSPDPNRAIRRRLGLPK